MYFPVIDYSKMTATDRRAMSAMCAIALLLIGVAAMFFLPLDLCWIFPVMSAFCGVFWLIEHRAVRREQAQSGQD